MRSSTFGLVKSVLCAHNIQTNSIRRSSNCLFVLGARPYTAIMSPRSVQPNGIASSRQHQPQYNITETTSAKGDLNNVASMRQTDEILGNPDFAYHSLAIPAEEDEAVIRNNYRPFLLDTAVAEQDWIAKLELATVTEMAQRDLIKTGSRLKVLVLYGSLRQRYDFGHRSVSFLPRTYSDALQFLFQTPGLRNLSHSVASRLRRPCI